MYTVGGRIDFTLTIKAGSLNQQLDVLIEMPNKSTQVIGGNYTAATGSATGSFTFNHTPNQAGLYVFNIYSDGDNDTNIATGGRVVEKIYIPVQAVTTTYSSTISY